MFMKICSNGDDDDDDDDNDNEDDGDDDEDDEDDEGCEWGIADLWYQLALRSKPEAHLSTCQTLL